MPESMPCIPERTNAPAHKVRGVSATTRRRTRPKRTTHDHSNESVEVNTIFSTWEIEACRLQSVGIDGMHWPVIGTHWGQGLGPPEAAASSHHINGGGTRATQIPNDTCMHRVVSHLPEAAHARVGF